MMGARYRVRITDRKTWRSWIEYLNAEEIKRWRLAGYLVGAA